MRSATDGLSPELAARVLAARDYLKLHGIEPCYTRPLAVEPARPNVVKAGLLVRQSPAEVAHVDEVAARREYVERVKAGAADMRVRAALLRAECGGRPS